MKTRSKALYTYLLEAGVLNGTPAEIDRAKCGYRKLYKRQWKENKRPRKEIRIEFTLKQFQKVKLKAREFDLRHTTYARQVILAASEDDSGFIPHREKLEKILQRISIACIAMEKNTRLPWEVAELLQEAETILMDYLNSNH
jgi:hypothetical protein